MSAPDTNIEEQRRKHKHSLMGIRGAMLFGILMMILLLIYVGMYADSDEADAVTNTNGGEAGVILNPDG